MGIPCIDELRCVFPANAAMTEEDSCNLIVSSGGTLAILLNSLTGQEKEGCVMRHGECMVLVEDGAHFEKVGAYQMG